MKRVVLLVLAMFLFLSCESALAAKARSISSDADSSYHTAHMKKHLGDTSCYATGNYIKTRSKANGSKIVGHLEQADKFILLDVKDGQAQIKLTYSDKTSPDSWEGMTGWVNSDYIDCKCSTSEYLGITADSASSADSNGTAITYYCKANNLRVRNEPNGEIILGHIEKADHFTVHTISEGWANITVTYAAETSPDSWIGLSGWVSTEYIGQRNDTRLELGGYTGGTLSALNSLVPITVTPFESYTWDGIDSTGALGIRCAYEDDWLISMTLSSPASPYTLYGIAPGMTQEALYQAWKIYGVYNIYANHDGAMLCGSATGANGKRIKTTAWLDNGVVSRIDAADAQWIDVADPLFPDLELDTNYFTDMQGTWGAGPYYEKDGYGWYEYELTLKDAYSDKVYIDLEFYRIYSLENVCAQVDGRNAYFSYYDELSDAYFEGVILQDNGNLTLKMDKCTFYYLEYLEGETLSLHRIEWRGY